MPSLDRTPPHDFEAERSALNLLMAGGQMPAEFEILDSTTFYEPTNAQIWQAAATLQGSGHACDAVAVNNALVKAGKHAAARRLLDVVTGTWSADAESLARVLWDCAGRRHYIDVLTSMNEECYTSEDDYETIVERAEGRLFRRAIETRDDVIALMPLSVFLGQQVIEPEWAIPGLLAKGERMILTGEEGLGKSTFSRQLAMCGAAGVEPFSGAEIPRLNVVLVDLENPLHIVRQRLWEIRQALRLYGHVDFSSMGVLHRPSGIDVSHARDRRWLARNLRQAKPDLLVIGPAYKLYSNADGEDHETIARTITSVLDDLRGDSALVLEAHAGNEDQRGTRPIRPFGSSLWRRWPEFGYGLRWSKPSKGVTPAQIEQRRVADMVAWRGARDQRPWPRIVESGAPGLPWVESVGYQ